MTNSNKEVPGNIGTGDELSYSSRDKLLATLERLLAIEAIELDTILNRASTLIAEALDCDKSDIFLFDASINSLVAHGTSNTPMGLLQRQLGLGTLPIVNGGNTVQVFLTGAPYCSGHVDQDPNELAGIKEALGIRSAMNVALHVDGQRRGVVQVDSSQPEKFTVEDLYFLEAVSRWLGMVTQRAELIENITRETKQLARRKTAEEMLEVLAHDMNNLLMPLGGWISILRQRARQADNQAFKGPAEAAFGSYKRLTELVKDLLDVRRLQYGLLTLSLEMVPLSELLKKVTNSMQTNKLRILLQLDDQDDVHVQADRARIQQVIENLVSNALKYSPVDVPVVVTLNREIDQDHDGREWATVTVHDEGPGIAEDLMATLFDRYSAGRESGGLGLGLYLAQSITKSHDGTLTVESNPVQGTTFKLALPALPAFP